MDDIVWKVYKNPFTSKHHKDVPKVKKGWF